MEALDKATERPLKHFSDWLGAYQLATGSLYRIEVCVCACGCTLSVGGRA
jgi:hypothetical protein